MSTSRRNVLTSKQRYRLITWFEENKESFEKRRLTKPQVAQLATDALKFSVNPANLLFAGNILTNKTGRVYIQHKWPGGGMASGFSENKRKYFRASTYDRLIAEVLNHLLEELETYPNGELGERWRRFLDESEV